MHHPDLITIEYAVNDITNPDTAAAYEALIRKCLEHNPDTAVVLIFTMNFQGRNEQRLHIPICLHYQLPMISYRDAVYPEIEKGVPAWEDISPDMVHPNDCGHRMIADMLCQLTRELEAADGTVAPMPLPACLTPGAAKYEKTKIIDASQMAVVTWDGWRQGPHLAGYTGWQTDTPGAVMEIRFSGSFLALGCQQYSGDFGRAAVSVDGREPVVFEGYFAKAANMDWAGGHTVITIIAEHLPTGTHSLKIEILPENHCNSHGYKFDIGYLLVAE